MPSEHSRSVHTTWLYTLSSVVFFVGFFVGFVALIMLEAYSNAPSALGAALIVLQLVAGAALIRFCWFLQVGRGGGLPGAAWTIALFVPAVTAWVLGLFSPGYELIAATSLWAACCLVVCLMPKPWRWPALGASAIVFVAHPVIATVALDAPFPYATGGSAWAISIYALTLPFMLLSSLWWWEIVVELDRHRRSAAELAVTQERLRFASDLHDIQGHHLQVISLKSELAERLLERDPVAAREHIHEVRLIAKEALEATRSLVAGYRQVSLADELENAREVLTAAGAECELRLGELPTDATTRSALASVVREATTNILRHSAATRVSIVLSRGTGAGRCELVIANDGASAEAVRGSGAAASGLAGLRERLAAVGGTIETSTDASSARFELRVSVPVAAEVTA
ncbi:sensor histidine kinase [Agromyces ramosus]|uniref:Two-component system sensor histidine kinase DesK n=1 Tax=Agromyces ramosus TaxID=33879 RepID=A0ABU0R5Y0_9MICO|nr:histidine kinase [Agromyces ramosus]MDQ0893492.1 two-component system sensor histidine kinase DesK [Agromyces ramosus]